MTEELGALIRRADENEREAADRLFTILYRELHRLAEYNLRRTGSGLTLGTTTLLHEAYLDLASRANVAFPDESRFLAYASRAMRGLVIDYARSRRTLKRGRQFEITLTSTDDSSSPATENVSELEQLGDALGELAQVEPALAELVDLHFFGGFSFGEIAAFRQVSERTVQRDWRKARIFLHHAVLDDPMPPNDAGARS